MGITSENADMGEGRSDFALSCPKCIILELDEERPEPITESGPKHIKRPHTLRYVFKNRKIGLVYLTVLLNFYLKKTSTTTASSRRALWVASRILVQQMAWNCIVIMRNTNATRIISQIMV